VSPVPSDPRLVTVVDGNPAVSGRELKASSARNLVPAQQLKAEAVDDEQAHPGGFLEAQHVRVGVAGQRGEDGGRQVGEA
jgi:hypothetical protein